MYTPHVVLYTVCKHTQPQNSEVGCGQYSKVRIDLNSKQMFVRFKQRPKAEFELRKIEMKSCCEDHKSSKRSFKSPFHIDYLRFIRLLWVKLN